MAITIYEMPHSPYCIPVTQALECFGVAHTRVAIPNWDRREVARLTGGRYYQVPVVVDGETIVFETADDPLAVPRYLDQAYFGGALLPEEWSGVQDVLVDHIEGEMESFSFKLADIHHVTTIEDVGERTMLIRHKERAFGRGCVDQWRAEAPSLRARLHELLTPFDKRLRHSPFLLGESPLYTDFALFGVLGNFTYNNYNELPESLEAVRSWQKRLAEWRAGSL